MNKKILAVTVVAIVAMAGVAAYLSLSKDEGDPIKIAVVKHNFEPMFIADKAGYFVEEGVKVELVRVDSGSASSLALATGRVHMAGFGPDPFLALANKHDTEDFKWVGTYMLDEGVQGAARRTAGIDLNEPETLMGKKIGINTSISYHSLFLEYLKRVNESIVLEHDNDPNGPANKVHIIHTENRLLAPALKNGEVDMIIGGAANAIVVEGDTKTFEYVSVDDDHAHYRSLMPVGLMATKNAIDTREGDLHKVFRAMEKACDLIKNDRVRACEISMNALGNAWGIKVQQRYFDTAEWGFGHMKTDDAFNTALGHMDDKYPDLTIVPNDYWDYRFLRGLGKYP